MGACTCYVVAARADFLVRGSDGRLSVGRQKPRSMKSERMNMHIPFDFFVRGVRAASRTRKSVRDVATALCIGL